MTADDVRPKVLEVLAQIAPEADLDAIDPTDDIREQLDLDSMDFLNVAVGVSAAFNLNVPERDYPKMATLDGCVAYILAKAAATVSR